jgi:hypothetical protein
MRRHLIAALALALGSGAVAGHRAAADQGAALVQAPATATGSAVLDWNQQIGAVTLKLQLDPLNESRLFAMVQAAVHDALNAIDRRFEPYALDIHAVAGASTDAAVATAAHDVLVAVLEQLKANYDPDAAQSEIDRLDGAAAAALGAINDGKAKTQGVTIGRAAAATILAARADDGAGDVLLLDFDYPQGTEPGQYRFVDPPPGLAFAPLWYTVTPFIQRDASQFKPRPPRDVRSKQYAEDVNEVQRFGGDGVHTPSARTPEQTQIAYFWFENSPAMWNRIAVTVALQTHLDSWQQARMLALMDMGMADGYIGNWYSKYALYNRWRPESAIRNGANDGNPLTPGDPTWTPLIPTGATPSYDSGHSIEGAVATGVMASVVGSDHISFDACSRSLPSGTCDAASPTLRHFTSLSAASAENGRSRILVGWHVRDEVEQGAKHGGKIAAFAVSHFLRPVHG